MVLRVCSEVGLARRPPRVERDSHSAFRCYTALTVPVIVFFLPLSPIGPSHQLTIGAAT